MTPKGSDTMPARKKTPEVKVETKAKRNFRSAEERIAEIDRKIAFHTKSIEQLETRKSRINAPRKRRMSYAKVFADLKASGKTPEEIYEFLKK
jgi:septal ring factor EnvC (AmiA/AmiB activator)